jgi:hypothetical protein
MKPINNSRDLQNVKETLVPESLWPTRVTRREMYRNAGFEVLTAIVINVVIFWDRAQ